MKSPQPSKTLDLPKLKLNQPKNKKNPLLPCKKKDLLKTQPVLLTPKPKNKLKLNNVPNGEKNTPPIKKTEPPKLKSSNRLKPLSLPN